MIDQEKFDLLCSWVKAREEARVGYESKLPKPWTEDEIVQNYRFCNVDRNNDTVTQWIYKNITWDQDTHPSTWFNLVLARFINRPETMEKLGLPWHIWYEKKFIAILDDMRENGEQIYNGAYMIRGGTGEDAGMPKHHYLVRRTFTPLWEARENAPSYVDTLQEWSDWFKTFFGMGDFMRNQVITDMRYGPLDLSKDWDSFIMPGPGTSRGLNRLHERPLALSVPTPQKQREVLEVRDRLAIAFPQTYLKETWEDPNNTSNCLCEFDKYCRVYYKEKGRPKSRYDGKAKVKLKPTQKAQLSKSALDKQRAAVANREVGTCEWCRKSMTTNMLSRWHTYERCKESPGYLGR